MEEKEYLKQQLIRLIKDHRKTCDKSDCNISLSAFLTIAKLAGLVLSEEEKKLFL